MRALVSAMLLLPACDDAAPHVEPPTPVSAAVAEGPSAALARLGGAVPTLARTLAPVPDAPSLVVTLSEVRFGDRTLTKLGTDGRIDAASLQGHLVGPVFDALAEQADRDKTDHGPEWNDTLVVIADAHVRVDVIADLIYTAGRAEYRRWALVAEGPQGEGALSVVQPRIGPDEEPTPSRSKHAITIGSERFAVELDGAMAYGAVVEALAAMQCEDGRVCVSTDLVFDVTTREPGGGTVAKTAAEDVLVRLQPSG